MRRLCITSHLKHLIFFPMLYNIGNFFSMFYNIGNFCQCCYVVMLYHFFLWNIIWILKLTDHLLDEQSCHHLLYYNSIVMYRGSPTSTVSTSTISTSMNFQKVLDKVVLVGDLISKFALVELTLYMYYSTSTKFA